MIHKISSRVLVLLDGSLHLVPLVRWDRPHKLLHCAHGPSAAGEEALDVTWCLAADLIFRGFLDLFLHCITHSTEHFGVGQCAGCCCGVLGRRWCVPWSLIGL